MKAWLAALILALSAPWGLGQGTLWFSNRVPEADIDAPVLHLDGTRVAGEDFLAQLYAGPSGTSRRDLRAVGEPLPFGERANAGYWRAQDNAVRVLERVQPNEVAVAEVRAWSRDGGRSFEEAVGTRSWEVQAGLSGAFTVQAGTPDDPAPLTGLESFFLFPAAVIPEPSSIALLALGFALWGCCGRRRHSKTSFADSHGGPNSPMTGRSPIAKGTAVPAGRARAGDSAPPL